MRARLCDLKASAHRSFDKKGILCRDQLIGSRCRVAICALFLIKGRIVDLRRQSLLHLVVLDGERDRGLISAKEHLLIKLQRTAFKDAISQIE